ncbi:MAG TPA: hypothetical protein VEA99_20955 [Gemmatimonadaceae bacterium]|nr:hypothetical protein [Gemmatimonadaceae bacterium]
MDSLITAAARALALGDPLGALNRVALRDDGPALALRGIALAQLGDLARAKLLLRRAARAFAPREVVACARCVVAEAEIALVSRDLRWPERSLAAARDALEAHGDRANAAYARQLEVRRLLLIGRLDEAERALAALDPSLLAPAPQAAHELMLAGIAMRRVRTTAAREALVRAAEAARRARVPALAAEVERARLMLESPAARLIERGAERLVRLDEVEALLATDTVVVDATRFVVRDVRVTVPLARRPILFALARALGEAWPADLSRDALVARAFGAREADESHRARLRVEIGRLRALLRGIVEVRATARGFTLAPRDARALAVLAPPVDGPHGSVLALLSDGEAWSSSALALALGGSQRSAQRALDALAAAGSVQPLGRGRARRWIMPLLPGFATILLLPAALGDV